MRISVENESAEKPEWLSAMHAEAENASSAPSETIDSQCGESSRHMFILCETNAVWTQRNVKIMATNISRFFSALNI